MEWRVKPIHQGEAPLSPCAAFVGVLEAQNWGNPAWKPSANPAAHASCTPECPARSALHDGWDQVLGLGLGSAGGRLRGSSPPASLPHGGQAGATLLYSQGLLTYDFTEACLLSPQLGPSRGQSGPPMAGGSSQKLLSLGNRGGCPRGSWSWDPSRQVLARPPVHGCPQPRGLLLAVLRPGTGGAARTTR